MRAVTRLLALLLSLQVQAQSREPEPSGQAAHGGHAPGESGTPEAMSREHPSHEASEAETLREVPLMRRGSGTSWQPDLIPSSMLHAEVAGWRLMFQGLLFGGYDVQGGRRGVLPSTLDEGKAGQNERAG